MFALYFACVLLFANDIMNPFLTVQAADTPDGLDYFIHAQENTCNENRQAQNNSCDIPQGEAYHNYLHSQSFARSSPTGDDRGNEKLIRCDRDPKPHD